MFSSEDDELYQENFKLINESILEVSDRIIVGLWEQMEG